MQLSERVMKHSKSCTLHTEEGSQSLLHCPGLSNKERCHYTFRDTHTHILRLTYRRQSCMLSETSSLPLPPKPKLLYSLEELPVIILTIYYSTSPLTQFWFDGGFPDSPELSKNLDIITLALGSSASGALCSADIKLWCVYVCQILIPTFAAYSLIWLSHISL